MSTARLRDPRFWLLLVAFLLTVSVLILPRVVLQGTAYDVLAIVDVTGSMNTRDVEVAGKPVSRLDYVKERLPSFVALLPCQSKYGLGIFSERRVFVLFEPMEVCENFGSIDASIAALNWRMAWEGDSHVASAVHDALKYASGLDADLLFLTDGHEAPPLPHTGIPPFEGKIGDVKGLIVGVGGTIPAPTPRFDLQGNEVGVYAEEDVLQENRSGMPPPDAESRPGYHPKWAPFGAMPRGNEHMSSVKEEHLRALAAQTGLAYAHLNGAERLLRGFEAAADPRSVQVAADIRPYPAGLALLLLVILFGVLPLYECLRATQLALPVTRALRRARISTQEASA